MSHQGRLHQILLFEFIAEGSIQEGELGCVDQVGFDLGQFLFPFEIDDVFDCAVLEAGLGVGKGLVFAEYIDLVSFGSGGFDSGLLGGMFQGVRLESVVGVEVAVE